MANCLDIKRRIAMTGIKRTDFAAMIDAEASRQTSYHVALSDLSRAYNSNGRRLTEKERWILATADRILREIEGAQVSERKEE